MRNIIFKDASLNWLRRTLQKTAVKVFPDDCTYCRKRLGYKDAAEVCMRCITKLLAQLRHEERNMRCPVCALQLFEIPSRGIFVSSSYSKHAVDTLISNDYYCSNCEKAKNFFHLKRNLALTKTRVLFNNEGFAKQFFYDYKFKKRRSYAKIIAGLAVREYGNYFKKFAAMVPVPPNASSIEKRGFCPVAQVVKHLVKLTGVPKMNVLRRRRDLFQKQLLQTERWEHASKGYKYCGVRGAVNKPLLIVDDIVTTGATIHNIAAVLKLKNPQASIGGFAVLRTESPER